MQAYNQRGVRQERTGFRDLWINEWHRNVLGYNCPVLDIDFLAAEYNLGRAAAIFDYKCCNPTRPPVSLDHPSLRAISDLWTHKPKGGLFLIPAAVVFYWKNPITFEIKPLNTEAKKALDCLGFKAAISELDFARIHYLLRYFQAPFLREIIKNEFLAIAPTLSKEINNLSL